jgi:CHAT domain-containing protein
LNWRCPKINKADEARLYLSEFEAQRIEKIFKDKKLTTKLVKRTEASKNVILDVLKQGCNVFHFAGHAQHNFKKPKKSKLYLANGDELTFEDVCHLYGSIRQKNIVHHRLVCLSACETAIVSPVSITTEYIGMSSAFLKAGAAFVVSTLWPVREIATSLFMVEFYRLAFSEGKSEITALRDAQSWLRNSTREELVKRYNKERLSVGGELNIPLIQATNQLNAEGDSSDRPFSSPYYWAAFIITGLPYEL